MPDKKEYLCISIFENNYQLTFYLMNNKLFLYLFVVMVFAACKNNIVKITGTLVTPVSGEYIFLDELKSNELKSVDSVVVTDKGTFKFKKRY